MAPPTRWRACSRRSLGEALGQPVIVENRPGSNGNLASEATARAAPDGHTLLLCADAQIVIGPHLYAKMPLDTLKDLEPVATLVNTQMILSVSPALPVKSLQEFIDYARNAQPAASPTRRSATAASTTW